MMTMGSEIRWCFLWLPRMIIEAIDYEFLVNMLKGRGTSLIVGQTCKAEEGEEEEASSNLRIL